MVKTKLALSRDKHNVLTKTQVHYWMRCPAMEFSSTMGEEDGALNYVFSKILPLALIINMIIL